MEEPDGLWRRLPRDIHDRVDEQLRQRRLLPAIQIVRFGSGLDPRPGLYEAQDAVRQRMRQLAEAGEVEPEPVVDIPILLARARAIAERVVAIEAIWDGDTEGWFVSLVAITDRPGRTHARFDEVFLADIRHGGDIRLFNGVAPPWPEAIDAVGNGEAVAAAMGVPFYFASPDTPDVDLPRWWDQN